MEVVYEEHHPDTNGDDENVDTHSTGRRRQFPRSTVQPVESSETGTLEECLLELAGDHEECGLLESSSRGRCRASGIAAIQRLVHLPRRKI